MSDASKKRLLWIATIALVVVAIVVVIALAATRGGSRSKLDQPAGDQVKIELRAKPWAEVRMAGKHVGRTPLTVVVKRSTQPIELEATFTIDKYRARDKLKITETLKETRIVVPDAEQSVDFDVAQAKRVDTGSAGEK